MIIGLIAGILAGILVRGQRAGFIGSIVVGLLGALFGGLLFSLLGVQVPAELAGGITLRWADMIVAFIGAVIILIVFGGLYRRRGSYRERRSLA